MRKLVLTLTVILTMCFLFVSMGCDTQSKGVQKEIKKGKELFKKGEYDKAIQNYKAALGKDPDNAVVYNLLGMSYRFRHLQTGTKEFRDKEIAAFKKATELDPKYWVAYKNLAASLYSQGKKKEAVPYLEKALELNPDDPEKNLLKQWINEGKSSDK